MQKSKKFSPANFLQSYISLLIRTLGRLYQGHILLRDNPCFHKTKASCSECKFLVLKQEKCYKSIPIWFFFSILRLLWQISPLGDSISKKSVNHTNLHHKTLYNKAKFISLDKIFDTWDTFGRGGETVWETWQCRLLFKRSRKYPWHKLYCLYYKLYYLKCIVVLTQKYTYIANWHCIDGYYWFCHLCQLDCQY